MAYSDFKTIERVLTAFNLKLVNRSGLFEGSKALAPTDKLLDILSENLEVALAIDTEKARSELIVMPILMEIRRQIKPNFSLFSGSVLSVDIAQGLNGECDFILSASDNQLEISAPVITIVEAKNNDIKSGLGQCAAQLVGAQKFNEARARSMTIYGAVTTGNIWRFMRLQSDQLAIDLTEYAVPQQIANVLGILSQPFDHTP